MASSDAWVSWVLYCASGREKRKTRDEWEYGGVRVCDYDSTGNPNTPERASQHTHVEDCRIVVCCVK